MRRRSSTWFLLCLACLLSAFLIWRLSGPRPSENSPASIQTASSEGVEAPSNGAAQATVKSASTAPFALRSLSKATNSSAAGATPHEERLKYRLTNTSQTLAQLADNAVSLENALIDSRQPLNFSIPDSLKAQGDPGSYIVQSRGPLNNAFRALLQAAGATIVSYIPNNAYLVRMTADGAQQLAGQSAAVIPFEPYYKLNTTLLKQVMEHKPVNPTVNVLVFADARDATLDALKQLGAEVVGESPSPFGTQMVVENANDVPAIARLPGIQRVEIYSTRAPANDLSRARVRVTGDTVTTTNYLNLSGRGVTVDMNDSGVDATHPDLVTRVFGPALTDQNGHGTHVAGIIMGDGAKSITVTNAAGSINPGTNNQYRGKAPAANLFVMPINSGFSDFQLQEAAARTNALISNNSWAYATVDYDINAASYDAAVRDALPYVTGSQPVLFVFAAGDFGGGDDNGQGGRSESIQSPSTAKNVITVGAMEQPRNITNSIIINGATSQPWLGMTDSSNQVAAFSARGNVGIGIEGAFGRFKPDLIAPGTFVVSTRSQQWDELAYYNPTNYHYETFLRQTVATNTLRGFPPITVPDNAVQVIITATATDPVVDLPIYVKENGVPTFTSYDVLGNNQVSLPPDAPLTPGGLYYFKVGNPTNQTVRFNVQTLVVTTNDNGNYFEVLSNLNNSIGPAPYYYRYESGTSMSAPAVSGVLALMQEFFQGKGITNSPALMKALLINGARSINSIYDLQVQNAINFQGWGLVNLTNSVPLSFSNQIAIVNPPANGPALPMLMFDQDPTNALATGDHRTYQIKVDSTAKTQPLRITLVWTDPPGNPAAGVKLVNNLDLVVTNLDNPNKPLVYFGNDIQANANFNVAWDTNTAPNLDTVNNVENVYLSPTLGTNYSVTVVARSVNVNAVNAQTNNMVQDYALVISSGNGQVAAALTLSPDVGIIASSAINLTVMTNQFSTASPDIFGQVLGNQRVGANSPLIGTNTVPYQTGGALITLGETNQWHFYLITNSTPFTNAVFATSLPLNLAPSRMGVTNTADPSQATRPQADIDLYVSTDAGLLVLDSNAVALAEKSLGRGGFEQVVYTNAVQGQVYYIGIKSEDHQAAEYTFTSLFSALPFDQGNNTFRGFPTPANIPDGTPALPGAVSVTAYAVGQANSKVRSVTVTNTIFHENFGDLVGSLSHNGEITVVLNNHSPNNNFPFPNVYQDNGGVATPGTQRAQGPGSLTDFIGDNITGQWSLTEVDDSYSNTGRVDQLTIHIEPHIQNALPPGATNGIVLNNCVLVQPGSFEYDFVTVPFNGISVQICLSNTAPVQLYVRNGAVPTLTTYDYVATINPTGSCFTVSLSDLPPLQPGNLYFGIYNPNPSAQPVCYTAELTVGPTAVPPVTFTSTSTQNILDDAVSYSSIVIPTNRTIASAAVGIVLNHPRVSDLALTLISPTGERYLLFENRGVTETNLGHLNITTNFFGTTTAGNAAANTNTLSPVPTSGTLLVNYQFFTVPDTMDIYYDGVLIYSTGLINGAGQLTIPYGPGVSTSIVIVMNRGNNTQTTAWNYTPQVVSLDYSYLTFTEDPSQASTAIKFARPPFDLFDLGTNYSLADFELPTKGNYLAPTNLYDARGGWTMTTNAVAIGTNLVSMFTNRVSVITDTNTAQLGSNYLALAQGTISRTIPTTAGRKFTVGYWYRGPGIVGWWRGEGNALDSSNPELKGNNGSLIGNFTFPEGEVGQAFQFGGTNGFDSQQQLPGQSYVQVPQSASLDVGSGGGLTVECWINPTNIFIRQPLVEWLAPIPTNWVPEGTSETNNIGSTDTNLALVAGPFLNNANGHYYYLLASTNWTRSEIWANALGGHLATVEDANEENWIYDLFGQYGGTNRTLWIGLNDVASPGTFAWAGGQTNLFYTNWANAQPSNCLPNQRYVAILNPTNAQASLWTLADDTGRTCGFPAANRIHGVVEVAQIQTNGVQFWVSVTNSLINRSGCLYADLVDTNNVSHIIFSAPGLLQTNGMQHVALTYDQSSGIAALYYSGTNVATTNLGVFVPKTGGDVLIGKDMSRETNNVFIGRMDEVSIYNRFLSASEIAAIYNISASASNRNVGKFDPTVTPALGLAEAQVSVGGNTNLILGANTTWQVGSFTFTATTNSMPLQITGVQPGTLLDSFTVAEAPPGNLYYLPETLLQNLINQSVQGTWTLEMRDTRAGPSSANTLGQLISWQLQFIYQNNAPTAVALSPFDPSTNVVPAGKTAYFTVDVPSWASYATNILVSASSPVDLLFNQTTPPTGTGAGDFTLLTASVGGVGVPVLVTNGTPPLLPGLRYYLGVKNNSTTTAATVAVRVDYDITTLSNGVPVTSRFATNEYVRYFAYDVSSNAYEATFQLLNLRSNVDLVIRKGTPLPTLTSSDFGSFNTASADENIYVLTNSSPVSLSPGRWYLGVFKRDDVASNYTILAKELGLTPPAIIDLANNVPFTFTAGAGAALTNFFRFTVTNSASAIHFELYNLSGNGDLTVQTNALPLAPPFWQSSQQPGVNPELIFIHTNSALTNLNAQWYLGVPNHQTNLITYTILAVIDTNGYFPAFPGAEGAGGGALGGGRIGQNGDVYHVVNLSDSGPGSLRDAVSALLQPRTVVFDVSGTITLLSPLKIDQPYLTIAGQTAPGDGITVRGWVTSVQNTHDVIVRYMRFRPGDLNTTNNQDDAFHFDYATDVIADHVSASWSIDEVLSATDSTNVTVQWSVIADSLNNSYNAKGLHGYGSLLRHGSGTLSFHHNLYADNYSRNPRLGDNLSLDFVNNVIYNWGLLPGYSADDSADNPLGFTNYLNYVNNYLIAGTNFIGGTNVPAYIAFSGGSTNTWIFQTNNVMDANTNGILDGARTGWGMFTNEYTGFGRAFPLPPISTDEAFLAYERVLAFVGTGMDKRDAIDRLIVGNVRTQSGNIIDSQTQVGGWPALNPAPLPLDTDRDGIPDYWEITFGTDPYVPSNNNASTNALGYTDLEEYINWLAAPHALTITNAPVDVDLYKMAGNTGNLTFFVTNAVNGTVYLTNRYFITNGATILSNTVAVFTPTNVPANFSGYAAFGFYTTNNDTVAYFGPVAVSVVVSAVTIATNAPTPVVTLTNQLAYCPNAMTNATQIDYYNYRVSTSANSVRFDVTGLTGDVDLYVRYGLPLPGPGSSDYASTNAGLVNESVLVTNGTVPVSLTNGLWYLAVSNASGAFPVSYCVLVTELTNSPIVTLTNLIPYTVTNSAGTNGLDYYRYNVSTNAYGVQFEVLNPNGDVNLYVRYGLPLPSPGLFDYSSANGGTSDELVLILTNMAPVPLTNGFWYLAVSNASGAPVAYTIRATELSAATIVTLTNAIPYRGTNSGGSSLLDYYRYTVSTNALAVQFDVRNLTRNVTLVARKGLPLPSLTSFDYISAAPGLNNEIIVVFTNSVPVALSPGDWYLTVANVTGLPVSYNIRALEITNLPPGIITLTNAIPYANSNSAAGIATDFYRFVITNGSARAQFEVDNPSGDVTLVIRRGFPLPSLASYDYISTNAYTNMELIVVFTNSVPVPLAPGNWFISVVNVSGGPVTYSVKATQWPVTGRPITITNAVSSSNSFCITWTSLPGVYYYVQGVTGLASTNWVTVSPAILAEAYSTTYCIPLPSPYNFFRVVEGLDQSQNFSPTIITLTNLIPYAVTNSAGTNGLDYYRYDVSTNAYGVQFEVLNPSGDVTLLARYGQPLPSLGLYDYISTNGGASNELILVLTNSLPVPVTPGAWYLAVSNASGAPVSYTILVTELTNAPPVIITLTNGIQYNNSNSGTTNTVDYYRYTVSTNAARAQFEVYNNSGDVTLVARKGLPLPSLVTYDYISTNAYTNAELIVIFTNSAPVALTPGDWYLSVFNITGGPVTYSVKATEWPVTGRPITITNAVASSNSFCITWASLPGVYYYVQGVTGLASTNWVTVSPTILATNYFTTYCIPLPSPYSFFRVVEGLALDSSLTPTIVTLTNLIPYSVTSSAGTNGLDYYRYNVSINAYGVRFEVLNPSGDVTLLARYGQPLPSLGLYDYISTNGGVSNELILVLTNSVPVPLAPGGWYLAVSNASGAPVNYTILATELTSTIPGIITLTNGIPYSNSNSAPGSATDYYRYVVTTNAARAQFEVYNNSGDVTLVARKGLPLPALTNFDYLTANSFTNAELIVVLTNSSPVALTPGDWYLGVVNISGGPVTYSVKATDWPVTGRPITITNAVASSNSFCITWASLPGVHYYIQGITGLASTNWITVSPTILATNSSTTYCVPLPSSYSFFRVVEGIVLNANTPPIFLSAPSNKVVAVLSTLIVTNNAMDGDIPAQTLTYTLPVAPTNSAINPASGVITWTPLLAQASTTNTFTTVVTDNGTPNLSATNSFTVVVVPAITIASLTVMTNGVQFQWNAPTNEQFQVQWASNLVPAITWNTFTNLLTSVTGTFTFLDNGSQSGGLGPMRFYRVVLLP